MTARRILILSFYFEPDLSAGSFRTTALVGALLQEDPFTRRSIEKPRGYTGDPEMLEFIFSPHLRSASLDEMARSIFHYTTDGPAPRSVRARAAMTAPELVIELDLGLGDGSGEAFGCDLTEAYVIENSEYTT